MPGFLADLLDRHGALGRRIRTLETQVHGEGMTKSYSSLDAHTRVVAEHLCHGSLMSAYPFGRVAAHLFSEEQKEENLEIARLFRVLREKVGTNPWIGNYRGIFHPHALSSGSLPSANGYAYDGIAGQNRWTSGSSHVRWGRWLYPVVIPGRMKLPRSVFTGSGDGPRGQWRQQYQSPVDGEYGAFKLWGADVGAFNGGMAFRPMPKGMGFPKQPDVLIPDEDSYVFCSYYDASNGGFYSTYNPPEGIHHHQPIKFGRGRGATNYIISYDPYTRVASYGHNVYDRDEMLSVPSAWNAGRGLPMDIGPPPGGENVGGHMARVWPVERRPYRRPSSDEAYNDNWGGAYGRLSDPYNGEEGLNKFTAQALDLNDDGNWSYGPNPAYKDYTYYTATGVGTDRLLDYEEIPESPGLPTRKWYMVRFATDHLRAAGPVREYSPAQINDYDEGSYPWGDIRESEYVKKPFTLPSFDEVVTRVATALTDGTVGADLLSWYESRLGGSAATGVTNGAGYPGTTYPFDADSYEHLWGNPVWASNNAIVWMLSRDGWVYLKGWFTGVGVVELPKSLIPDLGSEGQQSILTRWNVYNEEGHGASCYLYYNTPELSARDKMGLYMQNVNVNYGTVSPYNLGTIRWPVAK